MAEEVDVVGPVGQRFEGAQLRFQAGGIEHASRHRAQASGLAHRRGELVVLGTGHGGLDDGVLYAK